MIFQGKALNGPGSSPQVRGTRSLVCSWDQRHRFIPAGAGNTESGVSHGWTDTVHPRRCGEHDNSRNAMGAIIGSSPQVRGTHRECARRFFQWRFIPAGAGNTTVACKPFTIQSVHPRRCGEHSKHQTNRVICDGSSPQVRGTLTLPVLAHIKWRFIPAGAGNTTNLSGLHSSGSVHPRRCGEHNEQLIRIGRQNGSSPQVRGTHRCLSSEHLHRRFIPAGAGNTVWI